MIRNVIIIGNSGAALECHALLCDMLSSPLLRTVYAFKGFLSHEGYAGALGPLASLELGSDTDYIPQDNDVFALGIGNNHLRYKAYTKMKDKGGEFINLISPWAYLSANVHIGEGNIIGLGCSISNNVRIGDANYLNGNIRIGHDVSIGDGNFFGPQAMLLGNAHIGNFNAIAPSSMLMEKCKMGSNNKLAPASVLYKGCKDNCFMAGNPAIKMKNIEIKTTMSEI